MFESIVNLQVDKAYADLKDIIASKGCKIISEAPPLQIMAKQGSLWGITPLSAKKTLKIKLEPIDSKTNISFSSSLSSDWKNVTLVGCALAVVLVGLCSWMVFDLSTFMVTKQPSYWSWLVTVNGSVDFQAGQAFLALSKALAAFLSLTVLLEVLIMVYAHAKIDRFAEKALNLLSKR